ncbi:MAG: hypothetical protein GY757_44395, partial [bacterium]|nr:hypothetical protein [bacterium]
MDPRFGLLIKTKKPQVFETLEQIDKEIKRLKSNGRCIIADWKVTAPAAATNSELVVCVPSTAAFESLLTGTRTILFNPMRSGSGIFYSNNGLNRRIFEDAENMKHALIRYADGKDDTVGDCTDIEPQVDPFKDGQAAQRMGDYLKWSLEGFDTGKDRTTAIRQANAKYRQKWGNNRVTSENAYEPIERKAPAN